MKQSRESKRGCQTYPRASIRCKVTPNTSKDVRPRLPNSFATALIHALDAQRIDLAHGCLGNLCMVLKQLTLNRRPNLSCRSC